VSSDAADNVFEVNNEWIGEYDCCDEDPFGNYKSNVVGTTPILFAKELQS